MTVRFQRGQRVRLVRDVPTAWLDHRFNYPGIDYEEYERIHEPWLLLAGGVGLFDAYLAHIESLAIVVETTAETALCELRLGRRRFWGPRVPPNALEPCDPAAEITPLWACVKTADLPADHPFWEDREEP